MKKVRVKSTAKKIEKVIKKHEYFRNCYFWNGNNKSETLNWTENIKFKFNNKTYEILQECSSSSKNVYYSCKILVDGNKKDIRALKAII